ncbi:aminotransferase class III-fold pyridoxal phosphate-dependent enzyme [Rubrobacter tropicus]|uniref:Aminotransferase class III-fold pyridoxal phosphate-dependent enzyme n=1 Tax=Rubrobacter tropicus TaxID=2653851 RepID=A0A6G8QC45_9ACTN|nr:aspartate aminotransferase family protein [Rubrobacter tropicus]QIN84049.1 aminotransferase class III-fold pyridoxal phosphate-dependent enzyme [Rubrobacter tropicus]
MIEKGRTGDIPRGRVRDLLERERGSFERLHPGSRELYERSGTSLFGGVPMSWMMKWSGGFPVFAEKAEGSTVIDVDGNEYADFCLGDTGAMTGHAPPAVAETVGGQAARAITTMMPSPDAPIVGEALSERFGLPLWQVTLSATDANRFAIRMAREITGRPRILVFNWCYHGTVDETFAVLHEGRVVARPGNVGPPVELERTTRVVEFNDPEALEEALSHEDVACVLAEPAMTNIGIVPPAPGFHETLRDLTRRHGTLLVIDETHTISTGYGGYTREHGLTPDILTVGKTIGGGVPAGAFGLTREVAGRALARKDADYVDVGGVGGTLAGNALSVAAMRTALTQVLTEDAYRHTVPLAGRFEEGVREAIARAGAPWNVVRLGCRVEYGFSPDPPRNGSEAAASHDDDLETLLHLYALNRGVLITPFHNMALMAPTTTEAQVDRHTEIFSEALDELYA